MRSAIEALNRGDWERALAAAAPDFQYDLTRTTSPLRGVYDRSEMRGVVEEFLGSWRSVRYEPREFVAAPEGVVTPFTAHFSGRDGIELQSQATWVWTVRDGMLAGLRIYQDEAEAFADAGVIR